MDNRQVVQNFLGTPVRFFKATFKVDTSNWIAPPPQQEFCLETYAIPLPDFCSAIECDRSIVSCLIETTKPAFHGLYSSEPITEASGRLQASIIMAQEMVDGLVVSLLGSVLNDPLSKARAISFQRWIMQTVGLIRKGKLKFSSNPYGTFKQAPPEYRDILSLRSSHELAQRVKRLADVEGVRPETIYRRLRRMRGGNVTAGNGNPRKTRRER